MFSIEVKDAGGCDGMSLRMFIVCLKVLELQAGTVCMVQMEQQLHKTGVDQSAVAREWFWQILSPKILINPKKTSDSFSNGFFWLGVRWDQL